MMDRDKPAVLDYQTPGTPGIPPGSRPLPAPLPAVLFHSVFGIGVPGISFIASFEQSLLAPRWQSGRLDAWLGLIAGGRCSNCNS